VLGLVVGGGLGEARFIYPYIRVLYGKKERRENMRGKDECWVDEKERCVAKKKFILNTPVLTNWGIFEFKKVDLDEARRFVEDEDFISAVGHDATAKLLSDLLGVDVPTNRVAIKMDEGDEALITKLLDRLPEGKVLSHSEIMDLWRKGRIELGILKRLK